MIKINITEVSSGLLLQSVGSEDATVLCKACPLRSPNSMSPGCSGFGGEISRLAGGIIMNNKLSYRQAIATGFGSSGELKAKEANCGDYINN